MISDIPEKEWNVLNHKSILLIVVFERGSNIFMKISKFWIQSNLKNHHFGLKIFEKLIQNDSEASTSDVWQQSYHMWSLRPCYSKSGSGWTRSGRQNGNLMFYLLLYGPYYHSDDLNGFTPIHFCCDMVGMITYDNFAVKHHL